MYAIDSVAVVIVLLIALRVTLGITSTRRKRPVPEYLGNEPVFVSTDDDTLTKFQAMNRERRSELHDTLTIAELASQPSVLATLEDEEVITGTIVAVEDVPAPAPVPERELILASDDERVQGIYSVLHEVETQWHNLGSGWEPAADLLRDLDEDDWLYQLLTEDLVTGGV